MRRAVDALVEITYGGLFGRVESRWSLDELDTLGRITARYGVSLAGAAPFTGSLWIDDDRGRPDDGLVSRWQGVQWARESPRAGAKRSVDGDR